MCATLAVTTTTEEVMMSAAHEDRPWGSWTVLDEGEGFKVKRIDVRPHHRLSLQTHAQRSEHWTIVSGTATCLVEGREHVVVVGQALDVPVGANHRISNEHDDDLVVIEIQRGPYLGEDDIVRLEDDYGRHAAQ
jgi:mannose-6-phosphate isomerase-like protein (cupin superfamily)